MTWCDKKWNLQDANNDAQKQTNEQTKKPIHGGHGLIWEGVEGMLGSIFMLRTHSKDVNM